MDELRVLHAADLHIDSPMRGLVAYDGAPVEAIRAATRNAMRELVAVAIERRVHLVLISGDLYDGTWRDYNTGLFVVAQLSKLHEVGIPVVIVLGNHDAQSQLTRRLRLPPSAKVLDAARPERLVLRELGVTVNGQSYATRSVEQDLSVEFPEADEGALNIGMLHTCFDGSFGHDAYAPCTLEGLRSKRYDYWALGHVHQHHVVSNDPMIVFPGNLQGRHVRETGPKGASLVTFRDREPILEQLELAVVRFEHIRVDVAGASSMDEVLDTCRDELAAVRRRVTMPLAIRVELVGATALSGMLRSRAEQLTNEVRAMALALGGAGVWIEKVVVATTKTRSVPQAGSEAVTEAVAAVLAELQRDTRSLVSGDDPAVPSLGALRHQLAGLDTNVLEPDDLVAALADAAELLIDRIGGVEVPDAS
jgi:exonuclease SbcD